MDIRHNFTMIHRVSFYSGFPVFLFLFSSVQLFHLQYYDKSRGFDLYVETSQRLGEFFFCPGFVYNCRASRPIGRLFFIRQV